MKKNSESHGWIIGIRGMYATAEIDISDGEEIMIGRSPKDANLVISNGKISRRHCLIQYDKINREYIVVDKSTNGTYMADGTRLEKEKESRLPLGSKIFIADVNNLFCLQ